MTYKTEQETFWAGEFGSDYMGRNDGAKLLAGNLALFSRLMVRSAGIRSVIEFGANSGLNLRALGHLLPGVSLQAVEINHTAAESLRKWGGASVHEMSILDYTDREQFDLAFTKGVLIHIAPEQLPNVYDRLYQSSRRYVAMIEYYNPSPVEVCYRGHQGRLFKRDFAGEFLDRFKSVRLMDYGFVYRRDPNFPQDDLTWFLMEKSTAASL